MTVDYDLVVIGHTPAGVQAALSAVRQQARVALVEQPFYGCLEGGQNLGLWGLLQLARGGICSSWEEAYQRVQGLEKWAAQYTGAFRLGSEGIDFIPGSGKFLASPQLELRTPQRILRSRSYILATGCRLAYPQITGFPQVSLLTPFELGQMLSLDVLPEHLAIAGSHPSALQLAQTLQYFGKRITLLLDTPTLLPYTDADVLCLLQAQLEAQGITLYFNSPVTQIQRIEGKKWLLAGKLALEVGELIWTQGYRGNTEGLNLEQVGVEITPRGVRVRDTLQTTNPRIWAIGGVISADIDETRSLLQADIAVHNALFFPPRSVNYHNVPECLFFSPPLARIGIRESEARQLLGNAYRIVKNNFKYNLKAQLLEAHTGFSKIILGQDEEILGACILGEQAEELISIIALAMQQKLTLSALKNLPSIPTSLGQILRESNSVVPVKQDWRSSWLIWQRQRLGNK
jgi:pyruvate/2-oxoglutarate dehydrogenase complex dihydrolipoamide dehydrogenase (E3) component